MIIVEGCDNTGKSTLAKMLGDEIGWQVEHSIRPLRSQSKEDILSLSKLQLVPKNVILDRIFAISEYVYGRVLRGGSLLGELHAQAFLNLYQKNHLIIYCRPDINVIMDNGDREQMEGVVDNFEKLVSEYDQLIDELSQFYSGKIIRYDYTSVPSLRRVRQEVWSHVKLWNCRTNSAEFLTHHKGPVL